MQNGIARWGVRGQNGNAQCTHVWWSGGGGGANPEQIWVPGCVHATHYWVLDPDCYSSLYRREEAEGGGIKIIES